MLFRATFLLLSALWAGAAPAQPLEPAGPALAEALRAGGYVFLFRHAATDWSVRDAGRGNLVDCSTQRNLSDAGRADARRIGEAVRALRIPIGAVLASPFCRTRETAELAFGKAETTPRLMWPGSGAGPERMAAHREWMNALLGTPPPAGQNTVLVSHGFVASAALGVNLAEGEAAVVRPESKRGYALVARLTPEMWEALRRAAEP